MNHFVIVTKMGLVKKVDVEQYRSMGRYAKGLRGITLNEGDEVVGIVAV